MTGRTLPSNIPKRCLSIIEAAEYCSISPSALAQHGPAPTRIGARTVYDRRVLDRWLDELAGLSAVAFSQSSAETPEETLLEAIHARKAALRHQPS
jgi:hypothetical protein